MTGYEVTVSYPDIETLAAKGGDMFTAVEGRNAGAVVAKSWFYDTYTFDLFVKGEEMDTGAQDPESKKMVQSMLDQIQYRFTLNLPVKPETQNADSVSSDGKSLTWDLKATIAEGKDIQMQASYRIYNQAHIALTVGGIVLLLLCCSRAASSICGAGNRQMRWHKDRLNPNTRYEKRTGLFLMQQSCSLRKSMLSY